MDDKDQARKHRDDPSGYGGGRQRAEETPEHTFGERGWSEGRGKGDAAPDTGGGRKDLPEGVRDGGADDPQWQERFASENAHKYGQVGGEPTEQRGPAQSAGGYEHEEGEVGDTNDLSPRGGVGIRETEKWDPEEKKKSRR